MFCFFLPFFVAFDSSQQTAHYNRPSALSMDEPHISPPFLAKNISELHIYDVVGRTRPVHAVHASDTVEQVVKFLMGYHISSAPILDASDLLVGMIDFSDILHHLVAFGMKEENNGGVTTTASLTRNW